MKPSSSLLLASLLLICAAAGFVIAGQLGAREAREKIAHAVGLDKADRVHITRISGMGGDAVVEATIEQAYHFTTDKSGQWVVAEVRAGERRWESLELIDTAVKKEKILRTAAELTAVAAAHEAYRRERGAYVSAGTGAALIDKLCPRYLPKVIRLDAWSRELEYTGTAGGYRLISHGPDGKAGGGDDIVIENGKLIGGDKD